MIQKRRDREGNVSLPTLGLVAARCTEGFGGITYFLADSKVAGIGSSRGSFSAHGIIKINCDRVSVII